MSSQTTKSGKRSKDAASLITPPSASNPPKVSKINIPTPGTDSSSFPTPLLGIDSPVSFIRNNFLSYMEDWKKRYNILTPSALQPLQQHNTQIEANQQLLADAIKTVQENAATKEEITTTQQEFSKIKEENVATKREITLTQEEFLKMKQREEEMSATIEDLKTRCTWLSESLIEQRSSLEVKLNALVEKVTKIDTGSAQEVNRTIEQLNGKINNLEAQVNQYMVVTEQQYQIITCKQNIIFFILNIKNILYFLYFYIIFIYYY